MSRCPAIVLEVSKQQRDLMAGKLRISTTICLSPQASSLDQSSTVGRSATPHLSRVFSPTVRFQRKRNASVLMVVAIRLQSSPFLSDIAATYPGRGKTHQDKQNMQKQSLNSASKRLSPHSYLIDNNFSYLYEYISN